MQNFIRKWYPLTTILLLAAALRINLIFHRGTMWFDEYYSLQFSTIPSWADTIKYWVLENNPPFYHLFLRSYLYFVDKNNEILLRAPSIMFGLITIALLYIYAQKIFSRHTAILSSLFLALTTTHIRYSTEIRMYSLLAMLTIISFLLFHKINFEKKNTRLLWFFYTLLTTILLYTHLTAITIVIIQFISLFYFKSDKILIKKWLKSQATAIIIWAIWLIPSIISKLTSDLTSAWFFHNGRSANQTIVNSLLAPFIEFKSNNYLLITLIIFLIPSIVVLLYNTAKKSPPEIKNNIFLISVWALFPVTCAALIGVFMPQYLIFAYLGLFLLISHIIDIQTAGSPKKFIIALFFLTIIMLPQAANFSNKLIFTWKPLIEHIKQNETPHSITLVSYVDGFVFKKYYRNQSPLINIYTRQDNLTDEERLVRYNWNNHNIVSDEDAKEWLFKKIQENNADKIFFIIGGNSTNDFSGFLLKSGWMLKNETNSSGQMPYTLFEFDAPKTANCLNK